MGAKVNWYVKDRIVLSYFWGNITAEEVEDVMNQSTDYVQSGIKPVHSIVHGLEVIKYPMNLPQVLQMTSVLKNSDFGWFIMITDDRMARFMSSVVSQVTKLKFRSIPTTGETVEFLRDMDPSLPELPPMDNFLSRD
ncbi:MAG: hypothetical protein L0154_27375 [Chloroflexi bacterium]|nr:hypothetical protein [Chloroflexota bacterium]